MKFTILCSVAFLSIALSSPVEKTTNKKVNEAFLKCANLCNNDTYKPLCATDGDKLTYSFQNECALMKYNCEHNKIMTKKHDKECPNSQGIRLS